MNVLVIGGAGYLGCMLVRELLNRNFRVRVFDNLMYGKEGLEEIEDKIEVKLGDIRKIEKDILDDIDCVIHLAALSDEATAEYNPQESYSVNTEATERLARICKEKGIKKFIYASSCSVYDFGISNEEKDILLDEEAEVNPQSIYSISKYNSEKILISLSDKNFIPIILRKATIYGFSYRMRYDLVVNTFVKDALSKGYITLHFGGEMWRPLVEIRDVIKTYIKLLQTENIKSRIYNVVHSNFRISEVALRTQNVLKKMNTNIEIIPDYEYRNVRNYRVSGKRLQEELNIKLDISIEDSIKDMIQKINEYKFIDFDNPRYYNVRMIRNFVIPA